MGKKCTFSFGDHPHGVFWTKYGHIGPCGDLFGCQKARFGTIWGLKTARFTHEAPLWELLGGPKRSKNGSVITTLPPLVNWTIMWCLEPNLAQYKTSKGAKSALYESNRPPLTPPQTHQNPPDILAPPQPPTTKQKS